MLTTGALLAGAALLLVATGLAKLRVPLPTAEALGFLPLAARTPAAIALGLAEVVVGVGALVVPAAAAATAALYLGFAAYAAVALRSPGVMSCGCSGRADTPVTPLHLGLDLGLAGAAAAAAVLGSTPLLRLPTASLVGSAALAVVVAGAGWLAVTVHPQLVAARAALRTR